MKPSTRHLLIALGLLAGFAVYYRFAAPNSRPVVTPEEARRMPSVIPPQPKVDEEERRLRQEHQERLLEIYRKESEERNARYRALEGRFAPNLRPDPWEIAPAPEPPAPGPK